MVDAEVNTACRFEKKSTTSSVKIEPIDTSNKLLSSDNVAVVMVMRWQRGRVYAANNITDYELYLSSFLVAAVHHLIFSI